MKRLLPMDPWLTGAVLALMAFSVLMVASASLSVAEVRFDDPLRIIGHWIVYLPLGLGLMYWTSKLEAGWMKAAALPFLGLSLLLLVLVLVPGLGSEINGARRWFSVFGITLQPVELVKPAIIVYMAYYMAVFPERLRSFSTGLAPMLVVLAAADVLLIAQPDFGNALLLAGVCFGLWFVGGVPVRHLLGVAATAVPIVALAAVAEPYRLQRLLSFIDPWQDRFGSGYQLVQSMLAFGSGGLTGVGLGQGVQKLFYLPEAFTDFIGAVIGEELGLAGTLGLIALFGLLLGRAMWIAMTSRELFERLVVLGASLALGLAFLINLGAAMGILPTKGMPMPFVSYGGSALLGDCLLVGLILAMQRHRPLNRRGGER